MKTRLLLMVAIVTMFGATSFGQTRYLDEVFSDVTVTSNVIYGQNYSVLTGSPILANLPMDVYEPTGDTETERPLIVFLHTGSFLPRYLNQLATGDKTDSATVEICKRYARQGYVVANVAYRTGWNPQGDQDTRTTTILQAVYRGLQDAKTAVRFFRKDVAENGNAYGIHPNKIVVGGQGSGGYISLAYGSVDKLSEIQLAKFFDSQAQPMVDTSILGDWDGLYGNAALNYTNYPEYSSDVRMTFNIGGAIGDSTWIEAGEVPIVSIQGVNDAFAPFTYGIVTVPGTSLFVVDVSGASDVIRMQNGFGNNDVFKTPAITDAFTTAADAFNTANDATYGNGGDEGLYPFPGVADGNGPWEWFDEAVAGAGATAFGQDSATIVNNTYAGNPVYQALGPVAGKARAMTFIDTIVGYTSPRLYRVLFEANGVGIDENVQSRVDVYPNPASNVISFVAAQNNSIRGINFLNAAGQIVRREANLNDETVTITDLNLPTGIYFANIQFDNGITTKKIIIE